MFVFFQACWIPPHLVLAQGFAPDFFFPFAFPIWVGGEFTLFANNVD